MGFIRIKTRKSGDSLVEYAYLVSNSWGKRKKMARQKVKGYLGKIYKADSIGNEFQVGGLSYRSEMRKFVEFCLLDSGFKKKGRRFIMGDVVVDLYKPSVYTAKGRKCVVQINEGFICDWSLRQLFRLRVTSDVDGPVLAKAFRLAGLNVTPSNFVDMFQKGLSEAKK